MMDADRTNCDNPLDNASKIKIGEICDMSFIPLRRVSLPEYPGELFYSADDVGLLLSEMISEEPMDGVYGQKVKKIIDDLSIAIFEERENQ